MERTNVFKVVRNQINSDPIYRHLSIHFCRTSKQAEDLALLLNLVTRLILDGGNKKAISQIKKIVNYSEIKRKRDAEIEQNKPIHQRRIFE